MYIEISIVFTNIFKWHSPTYIYLTHCHRHIILSKQSYITQKQFGQIFDIDT